MMIAGYETTATSLAFASYELAVNPDVQRKLQAEVDEHFPAGVSLKLSNRLIKSKRLIVVADQETWRGKGEI